jgi:outer membrane protein TolC
MAAFIFQPVLGQKTQALPLTLEECIAKALKNNLNVAVETYNPELAQISLHRAKEMFLPRFDVNYGSEHQESPPYWWIQGANTVITKYSDYGVSFLQQIPTGASLSLSLASYSQDTTQSFQLINPRYGSAIRLDITQPLLKNFGPKVSRREILMAEDSLDVSRDQLKNVMLETIYLVEEAYWTLVYAIEDYKVKERSLQLGRNLLAKNKKEVEFGQLAPLEILNAEAVVASREADILQAEALIKRFEEVLKTIINVAAEGEASSQRIVPSDKPDFVAREISRDQCLREALDSRPDLRVLKKTIETKDLNLSVARNQTLPGLDLQFSYWSPGLSGDRLIYENDSPLLGVVIGKEKGSRYDSLRDSLKLLYKNWTIGLTLSLPLSNFLSRAELAYARTDLSQAQTKLKNLEQQVILEVSDAVRSIETNARRVHAYRLARELSEKRLEAEEKKLAVGLSTNYFVLEFQEQLANAQSAELKALVDYNLSLARLEKATGQGLESRRILGSPPEK